MTYYLLIRITLLAISGIAALGLPLHARSIEAGPDEIIEVRARLRFATAIVLPEDERILDWICGDAEYWSVQGTANLAFVKPTAENIRTNVTLVTNLGNIYTLLFRELGDEAGEPDLKLFLHPKKEATAKRASLQPLRFASHQMVEDFEQQAILAREQERQIRETVLLEFETRSEEFRSSYPGTLQFDYVLDKRASDDPFNIHAMWRDERFTYIAATPLEAPTIYEQLDGQPAMVPFDLADGLYVIRRVLRHGWLQVGKRKLNFRRNSKGVQDAR